MLSVHHQIASEGTSVFKIFTKVVGYAPLPSYSFHEGLPLMKHLSLQSLSSHVLKIHKSSPALYETG